MIKRLRLKFICVSLALVTVLLAVILGMICRFTWKEMENQSLAIMQAYKFDGMGPTWDEPMPVIPDMDTDGREPGPSKPNNRGEGLVQPEKYPCFALILTDANKLEVSESRYYDLSDDGLLWDIFNAARETGKTSGILFSYSLRYYRADSGQATKYVFMDISTEISAMQSLFISCGAIGLCAFVVFFLLIWALSGWMVRPVEEAWNRQRQFVADASHELKTPLTVILTNAELLESEEYDPEAKSRFVRSIHTMSVQMRGLVESLLDMARVDSGNLRGQMVPVDFSRLVEEAALPFEALYFEAERTLESSIKPGLSVLGSAEHLRQVVEILLDNGRKYSLQGTTVNLRLEAQGRGRVLLRVSSRGEKLTAQQCRDIFKRFYRVDEARKMNHSYGLGLSIAQSIVFEHKGRIWCESKDDVNTFYVNLPAHH